MKNLLKKLKRRLVKQESTFISHRYKKYERLVSTWQNYIKKLYHRQRNAYENQRGRFYDSQLYAKFRAMIIDILFTWFVFSVIMLCIMQPVKVYDIISTILIALGISVLTPVMQYYIKWYFQVREKPFKE